METNTWIDTETLTDLAVVEESIKKGAVGEAEVTGVRHRKVTAVAHVVDIKHCARLLVATEPPANSHVHHLSAIP